MAHYAKLDESNIVTRVVAIGNENCLDGDGNESEAVGIAWCENFFKGGTWIQTSFNTKLGKHWTPLGEPTEEDASILGPSTEDGGTPFRKNYAGIGYKYDATRDAFYEPNPDGSWTSDGSWTLNEDTCRWEPS